MNYTALTGREGHCYVQKHNIRYFAKIFAATLMLVFIFQFNVKAQNPHPSCNISGPLEAKGSGPDIIIDVEVAHSSATPKLDYQFVSNSAGAFIRTKGPVVYTAATNSLTQKLTISPGTNGTEFNLKLIVTTPNGDSECSKSVSVSR